MRKSWMWTNLLLAFLASGLGRAQIKKAMFFGDRGYELVEQCKNISVNDPEGKGDIGELKACIGFISGVIDGSTAISKADPRIFPVCVPVGVNTFQLAKVVTKYGADHPENLHWMGYRFVTAALQAAFPCPTSSP